MQYTKTFNKIVKIGLSDMHSGNGTSTMWALGDDGSLWVWGYNNNGQTVWVMRTSLFNRYNWW